jgi:hypothetical protein
MYRKDGSIPELSRDHFPKRLIVFDTEAFRSAPLNGKEVQTFRIAVTRFIELNDNLEVVDQEYSYFMDIPALLSCIDHFSRKDKTLYIYAHNIKYDLQLTGLLKDLLEAKWVIKNFVFEDPPTFIKLTKNRSSITFIDTFNYWQFSLSKMGEQLNKPKLDMPKDNANPDQWFTYCKRDVEVLSDYLLSFMRYLKENDLCGLGLTLASQSFRSYRHKFMNHPITLHNRPEALTLERSGYSGGRVEAFRIGDFPKQPYYKLDVNSMYPYVMKGELYPHNFIGYTEDLPLDRLEKHLKRYYVIAEVTLNTDQAIYPVKTLHKLIFPIGSYKTTLHTKELQAALSADHIRQIHRIAIYDQADLFTDYIDFFYNLKLQAELDHNPIIRHQAKIMMNSLYGKFGQRNVRSKITPNTTDTAYGRITGFSETLQCRVEVNCLGSSMEVSYKQGESTYSFPGIAGAVTANARIYLWKLMTSAGLDHVFYIDTDSLIVDSEGYQRLTPFLHLTELGKLKLEDTSDTVHIWGAKDYVFGAEVKHKGVPKAAKETSEGVWDYEQFRGAKTWLSDGLNKDVEVYSRTKSRKSAYDKGVIMPDNTISPIVLR